MESKIYEEINIVTMRVSFQATAVAKSRIIAKQFLFQGRAVIRPIAFKPTGMSPSSRFGLDGERYGSTPILTRSGIVNVLYYIQGGTSKMK